MKMMEEMVAGAGTQSNDRVCPPDDSGGGNQSGAGDWPVYDAVLKALNR